MLPESFDGIVWCPHAGDAATVGFQLAACDGAVVGASMSDHARNGDFGEPKRVIIEGRQVQPLDSFQDLFFDFLPDCSGDHEFLERGFIKADVFLARSGIGSDSMSGCRARMCRELEDNAGKQSVFRNGHDEAKMSMATPAASGRNGSGIGIEFFGELLDCSVGRCANDGGQLGMRERESGRCRRHVRKVVCSRSDSGAWMLTVQKSEHARTK